MINVTICQLCGLPHDYRGIDVDIMALAVDLGTLTRDRPADATRLIAAALGKAQADGARRAKACRENQSIFVRSLMMRIGYREDCPRGCGKTVYTLVHQNGKKVPYTEDGVNHLIECPIPDFREKSDAHGNRVVAPVEDLIP